MSDVWTAVDDYTTGLFFAEDSALVHALQTSAGAGLPAISVTPNQGQMLQILARSIGARTILEIGTLGGYSTIWLARALPIGGNLITLELDPRNAEIAQGNINFAGMTDVVEIRVGDAVDTLAELHTEGSGPFDFVFIDANKSGYPDYFLWSMKLVRPGGLMVIDNVVRRGAIVDLNSEDANVIGVQRMNDIIARTPGITVTTIQTVGAKGYDGFTLVLVDSV